MFYRRLAAQLLAWPARWFDSLWQMGRGARYLMLAMFLWGIGEGLWVYIRPLYITHLGATPVQVGQVLGVMGLAPVLVMLPAGRLIDRFGPYRIMILGWYVGLASIFMIALAPDWQWLIPAFFLYASSAFAIPALQTFVTHEIERQQPGVDIGRQIQSTVAAVMTAYIAGTIFSPVVGGWLGGWLGLRSVFWIAAGWFALSALAVIRIPRPASRQSADLTGTILDRPKPAAPWWRLSSGQLVMYAVLMGLFFCWALGNALVPTYLEEARALSVAEIGGLGTATALGGVVWLMLLRRRQSRQALVISAGLMALAMMVLLFAPVDAGQLAYMVGVYFMLGTCMVVRPLSLDIVSKHTPPEQRGTGFAMVETIWGVGVSAGSWVAGFLYSRSSGLPFQVTLIALLPLMVLTWFGLRAPGAQKTREQPLATPASAD